MLYVVLRIEIATSRNLKAICGRVIRNDIDQGLSTDLTVRVLKDE